MTTKEVMRFAKIVHPFVETSQAVVSKVRRWSRQQGSAKDWPWNRFVHAFASNGGSRYWNEKISKQLELYNWKAIARLSARDRKKRLALAVNPRWRHKNAPYFEEVFHRFKNSGGPRAVSQEYNSNRTSISRIAYWKSFPGIGDKFAREIPMRSYDPFFRRGHFALDARLKRLLKVVFNEPLTYAAGEAFFISVAEELDVSCWELDVILYENFKEIKPKLLSEFKSKF